ncbi:hypothetical protein NEUTE1DRAFT_108131 [Neurospora tetrasperma FGSC 2508]|uniref:Uncharacterized protein n=1 Tax=Neurospora tetrasperma (strain FGSC 2508 / ATCC MYA-4615 / P0657) TaxID=510951 RepID=F8MEX1_NEUT8|nr:uncharacterized protein NEUTE1DRAFT_108131 [Neurospora tetrasperma FGSC 2508]EGO61692.1 hypothetical protein NEUTE1DRAFT_108131 [Neurospora tetrasperma FGSC 2508]
MKEAVTKAQLKTTEFIRFIAGAKTRVYCRTSDIFRARHECLIYTIHHTNRHHASLKIASFHPAITSPRLLESPCQYLIASGSAKKKLVDHGKEHEGFKRHDEHKEEEARAKQTDDNEKLRKTNSVNKNMDFKTDDASSSKQSN